MPRLPPLAVALVIVASGAAGCTDEVSPTPTEPTTPTVITETFAGTLERNDAETTPFTVASSGTVRADLRRIAPDDTVAIGMSLGTWNGTACQVVLAQDRATQGSSLTATVSSAGRLCLRVYDTGAIVDPITWEVDVNHP
jgi:hypothetical protein